MSEIKLRYYLPGGLLLGLFRGVMEVVRLHSTYPLDSNPVALSFQIICLYGITISILGLVPACILLSLLKGKAVTRFLLPIAWLSVLIGLDIWGFWTPVPVSCRCTQGMPARYSAGSNASDVLIITLDTFRADYTGAYGNNTIRTPTLDRLARTGVTVIDAIAPIPITTSSHATIFTGLDPPEHGSRFNAVPIHADSKTMAEMFRDYGYKTGAFVSAFPVMHEVSGLARGFDVYDQLLTPSRLHPLLYRTTIVRGFTRFGPFRPAERKWFRVIPPVLKWWSNEPSHPRFTWVHFYDPHFPYEPRFPFDRMYLSHTPEYTQCVFEMAEINRAGVAPPVDKINEYKLLYAGEISAVDHAVEQLIRALFQQERFDRTAIVVTADHGESLDEHDYYFAHGNNLYDPSIRVPLVFSFPNQLRPNLIVPGQMRLASLAKIIYSLMNFYGPHPASLCSVETSGDEKTIAARDHFAFSETGSGVFTAAHVPSADNIRKKQRAIRSPDRKVIFTPDDDTLRYNLADNPSESRPFPSDQTFSAMSHVLSNHILESDALDSFQPAVMDEQVLRQLELLGYIY
jgi:arylsulfatase A-like enzyme